MNLQLAQPLKDLRGNVLLSSKVDILEWAKKAIMTHDYLKKKTKFKEASILLEDFESLSEIEPYKTILGNWVHDFREWVGEIWAPSIIFDELKFQRERDPYAYRHTLVIALVGARLLEFWIHSAPTLRKTFQALLFHDLGKTRVAPNILEKKETLTDAERRSILEHPLASYVLNGSYWGDLNHLCAEVALHHHEDRAGKGYPRGIKTNSLILDILLLLDRFDALISERPFRLHRFSVREAFDILKKDVEDNKIEGDVLRAFATLARNEKISNLKKIKLGTIGRGPKNKNEDGENNNEKS